MGQVLIVTGTHGNPLHRMYLCAEFGEASGLKSQGEFPNLFMPSKRLFE